MIPDRNFSTDAIREQLEDLVVIDDEYYVMQRDCLSFSWYCRRLFADTVAGAAKRIGETMFGRALVNNTLPEWAGTTAAILLNMAGSCESLVELFVVSKINQFEKCWE